MPFNDLRQFISALEQRGELARVAVEADPRHEMGAICYKVSRTGGPGLFFEKTPAGIPVAMHLLATRRRYAIALETDEDKLNEKLIGASQNPIEPQFVRSGPCKENIIIGREVDLFKFPIPTVNERDGGPYITFPVLISRDPVDGWLNAGIHRMQVHDQKTTGLQIASCSHLLAHMKKAKGGELPLAVAIGSDPALLLAAAIPSSYPPSELAIAGGMRREPLEMVRCETIDLAVPASAEIVLEGVIPVDSKRLEGPFGEFTGYYGFQQENPVFEVRAITHRNNPIYLSASVGLPYSDANALQTIPLEPEILRQCRLPGIKRINVPVAGACLNCIVSIEKTFDGYGKMVGSAILGTWAAQYIKNVIVVDDDIDPFNMDEVMWALATRFRPKDDLVIFPDSKGMVLDPSLDEKERLRGTSSKVIIDATKPVAEPFPEVPRPSADLAGKIERKWRLYNLP